MDEAIKQVKDKLSDDNVVHIKDATKRNGEYTEPYPIGFEIFDKAMMGGVRAGDFVVVTGIKKHGKTSVCQDFSVNLSKDGNSCLWFSYEVIIDNFYAKFKEMDCDCDNLNIYSPKQMTSGNLEWIQEKIEEGVKKFNARFIFIDHLGFITPKKMKNSDQKRMVIEQIVTELKTLAVKLEITIFLIAHVKKVQGRSIESQDISESITVSQTADFVFGIQRSVFYDQVGGKRTEHYGEISTIRLMDNRLTGDCPMLDVLFINNRIHPVGNGPIDIGENKNEIEVVSDDEENNKQKYFWQKN